TIIIDLENNIWAMGNNSYGQLGLNNINNRLIPTIILFHDKPIKAKAISCGYNHTIIIDIENNVWAFGANYSGQLGLNDRNNRFIPTIILFNDKPIKAKSIACGSGHT